MPTARGFTDAEYLALSHLFSGGDISSCSKGELERFAVMLSRPNAFMHFGDKSFPQICETVRTLLIVRMSEQQNDQAKRESRLALIIAVIALVAGMVQAVVSLAQYFSNAPIQVQANLPLSIRADLPLPVYVSPSQSAKKPATLSSSTHMSE